MAARSRAKTARIPTIIHHKASGQARVRIRGRDHYFGKWDDAASMNRAKQFIAQYLARGSQLPGATSADGGRALSVDGLMARFWEQRVEGHYVAEDGSPTSEVGCWRAILKRIHRLHGETAAAEFAPADLKLVRDDMISDGLARSTINSNIGRLKRLFRWGVAEELVPSSVFEKLKAVEHLQKNRSAARESPSVGPVSSVTLDAVLPLLSPVVATILQVMALTGMRPGEAVIMRARDIDRTGDVWGFEPPHHKTKWRGKERYVGLGLRAQKLIRPFLSANPEAFLFPPPGFVASEPPAPAAARRPKAHYTTASLRRAVQRACRQAGVEVFTPNQIRHLAGTKLRETFGIDVTQQVLGHSSPATTAIYAELSRETVRRAMRDAG